MGRMVWAAGTLSGDEALTNKPLAVLSVGSCQVVIWKPDYIETQFPDGSHCPALFAYDAQARDHAKQWGYGSQVWRMHVEHELTHTVLAQESGLEWSPVLHHVAGGPQLDAGARLLEEHRVVTQQKTANRVRSLVREYVKAVQR
jgi:hypothetical protein